MNLLQNVKVKLFLQDTVFLVLNLINKTLHHDKNLLLFYINTDLRESNKSLLDYLIEHHYNKKYQIVCACNNPHHYKNDKIDNVKFTNRFGGVRTFLKASKVFYSIGKIPIEPAGDQKVIQMWHGTPLKAANEGWRMGHRWSRQHYTYLLCPSKHYAPIFSDMFSVPMERIFIGGYPRCEALFKEDPHYDFGNYEKLILWAPTFRKSNDHGMTEMRESSVIVPVLENNEIEEVNEYLKSIKVKIVVKLHPMQDISGFNFEELDNFILLTHDEFVTKGMDLYRLCVQSDALITDYSSIFFDYLLTDKPIGFTEDDVEEYKNGRGFCVDNPDDYKPGMRIKNKEELTNFCLAIKNGIDCYKSERERVRYMTNDYVDGKYCERILDVMGIYATPHY